MESEVTLKDSSFRFSFSLSSLETIELQCTVGEELGLIIKKNGRFFPQEAPNPVSSGLIRTANSAKRKLPVTAGLKTLVAS